MKTHSKRDLLTLTEATRKARISLSTGRRAIKAGILRPDATTTIGYLFLPSRVPELRALIHPPRNLFVEPQPLL